MLKAYRQQMGGLKSVVIGDADAIPPDALWVDMLNPTLDERRKVDAALGIEMPTRADMEEIEISSRLYQEDGSLFMTAMVLAQTDAEIPLVGAVTFVLSPERLVTIRYIDPQALRTYIMRLERTSIQATRPELILVQIIDTIIDRMADIQEKTGLDVEAISRQIFEPSESGRAVHTGKDFQDVLRSLGRKYDLTSKMRESLLTIGRMLTFLSQAFDMNKTGNKDVRAHIKTASRDVLSLQDHSTYVSNKLTFLLDATLGLINIEQNNIIKIMSVAAIVFLPPTVLASIWGMNFKFMPELDEVWGYPLAILIILIAGALPYIYFKRRDWL
jgi:magnesium transporter